MIHSLVIGLTLAVTSGSDFSESVQWTRSLQSDLCVFSDLINGRNIPSTF